MSENASTLAVWAREALNNLPRGDRISDEQLFEEIVRPDETDLRAFFSKLSATEVEALCGHCLKELSKSDTPLVKSALQRAEALVATAPRQHGEGALIAAIISVGVFSSFAIVAILLILKMRKFKRTPDGGLEITFFPHLPEGTREIVEGVLRNSKGLEDLAKKLGEDS